MTPDHHQTLLDVLNAECGSVYPPLPLVVRRRLEFLRKVLGRGIEDREIGTEAISLMARQACRSARFRVN